MFWILGIILMVFTCNICRITKRHRKAMELSDKGVVAISSLIFVLTAVAFTAFFYFGSKRLEALGASYVKYITWLTVVLLIVFCGVMTYVYAELCEWHGLSAVGWLFVGYFIIMVVLSIAGVISISKDRKEMLKNQPYKVEIKEEQITPFDVRLIGKKGTTDTPVEYIAYFDSSGFTTNKVFIGIVQDDNLEVRTIKFSSGNLKLIVGGKEPKIITKRYYREVSYAGKTVSEEKKYYELYLQSMIWGGILYNDQLVGGGISIIDCTEEIKQETDDKKHWQPFIPGYHGQ